VHKIRSQHQGILVGKKTVLTDNPKLDVRYWIGENPVRIVLSEKEAIPSEFNINNNASETLYINKKSIADVLKTISESTIISVLVEGGATVLKKFIEENLWDEAIIITSEEYLNNGIKAPEINGSIMEEYQIGNNLFQRLKNTNDLSHS
jgi:diaminohydroxyphosphoribosylaminopyrimidine deaminase/5-amino-6-(5-phosphoribosylamino)uracil reductase